jgi:hypothetical protein
VRSECPPGAQGDIDSLSRFATVSTVGFGVGVAGLGTALVLGLVSARGGAAPPESSNVSVVPWVGAGSAGLAGSF